MRFNLGDTFMWTSNGRKFVVTGSHYGYIEIETMDNKYNTQFNIHHIISQLGNGELIKVFNWDKELDSLQLLE